MPCRNCNKVCIVLWAAHSMQYRVCVTTGAHQCICCEAASLYSDYIACFAQACLPSGTALHLQNPPSLPAHLQTALRGCQSVFKLAILVQHFQAFQLSNLHGDSFVCHSSTVILLPMHCSQLISSRKSPVSCWAEAHSCCIHRMLSHLRGQGIYDDSLCFHTLASVGST